MWKSTSIFWLKKCSIPIISPAFLIRRNTQITFVEKSQIKINSFQKSYHYMLQVELKGVEKKHNAFFNVRTTWFKSRRINKGGQYSSCPPPVNPRGACPPTGIYRQRLKSGVVGKTMSLHPSAKSIRGVAKKISRFAR